MAEHREDSTDEEFYCSSASQSDTEGYDDSLNEESDLLPYQFEPIRLEERENATELVEPTDDADRLSNTDWCSCSMCSVLPTARECQCCCEIEKVVRKVESFNESAGERISCITGHPGFATVCLDPYVLETAYYQYRQQYGDLEMPFVNEKNRYVAYRQLTRWCWGFLGKDVRVVLPACAVLRIRAVFPSEEFRGFEDS